MMLVSDFGGILEIVVIVTALVVGSTQQFLFLSSILKKIFLEEVPEKGNNYSS